MSRGPLPNPQRRRTNAPTIPTIALPATGRTGTAPRPPKAYSLNKAGAAWWKWAWHTPQSAAWGPGDLYTAARRASLEDDLAALSAVQGLDAVEALDALDADTGQEFRRLIQRLAALATGRIGVMKEIRELDDRLGLTPKAMAQLRWSVEAEPEKPAEDRPPAPVRRLRAVDTEAATGA